LLSTQRDLAKNPVQNVLLKETAVQHTEVYGKTLPEVVWDWPLEHLGIKTEEKEKGQ